EAFGHDSVASEAPEKYLFSTLTSQKAASPRYVPPAAELSYGIDLALGRSMDSASQNTTIAFRPAAGDRAIRFDLTASLQVESVPSGQGQELSFLQWRRDTSGAGVDLDESVLVDLGDAAGASSAVQVRVASSGSLFEPWGDAYYLIDEDAWYPSVPGHLPGS